MGVTCSCLRVPVSTWVGPCSAHPGPFAVMLLAGRRGEHCNSPAIMFWRHGPTSQLSWVKTLWYQQCSIAEQRKSGQGAGRVPPCWARCSWWHRDYKQWEWHSPARVPPQDCWPPHCCSARVRTGSGTPSWHCWGRACWLPSTLWARWNRPAVCSELPTMWWVTWSWSIHTAGCHQRMGGSQDCTSWRCDQLGWCKWWKVWAQGLSPAGCRTWGLLRLMSCHQ